VGRAPSRTDAHVSPGWGSRGTETRLSRLLVQVCGPGTSGLDHDASRCWGRSYGRAGRDVERV